MNLILHLSFCSPSTEVSVSLRRLSEVIAGSPAEEQAYWRDTILSIDEICHCLGGTLILIGEAESEIEASSNDPRKLSFCVTRSRVSRMVIGIFRHIEKPCGAFVSTKQMRFLLAMMLGFRDLFTEKPV